MNLRRKYISIVKNNRAFQKCLAITILLKSRLKSSRIHYYTTNKLCKIAGISHKTAERYEKLLEEYGLIHFEGNMYNRVLIVNSITSHTANRNICIDEMDVTSFFSVYRSVQSFIFMYIQHNKDFIRYLLQARHNPENPKEFRTAKRKVKDLVEQGKLCSTDVHYKEHGLSLSKIAENVGCCVRTVQRVVKYAAEKSWVEVQHNHEWFYAPHVSGREIEGFTFSTKHKLCIVHPNTYTLSSSISQALSYIHGLI